MRAGALSLNEASTAQLVCHANPSRDPMEFDLPPHLLPKATIVDVDNRWVRDLTDIDPCNEIDYPKLSYVAACECGAWHLKIWPKNDPRNVKSVPFKCGSWRHQGECRLFKGAQDFVRIRQGMEKYDFWSHVTLTFDEHRTRNIRDTFRNGVKLWAKLRKRCETAFAPMKYIQTWEIHRSGVPHIHLALMSVKLYESSWLSPKENWIELLQKKAVKCGFGPIGWVEPLRSRVAMAGYLGRLARELTGSGKDFQVPINAPKNFRRIRASVRLLPPIAHNPDITGVLKFCQGGVE
jgi:hypothetical protein